MAVEDKTRLSPQQIGIELRDLEGWVYLEQTRELCRVWVFERFVPTMAMLRALTLVMDENNHHSDIQLDSREKTLTVKVSTHSAQAITRADIDFAKAVNAIS
ncbi:MAG: 4a-hydroxytetrahydrobiopterin dehydratase [bacterium]|jgi:pterin-4a-carbinolamine dehydratase|nr:4a-hydroxytetrahydrobiopterin dehydratase [bacterium]